MKTGGPVMDRAITRIHNSTVHSARVVHVMCVSVLIGCILLHVSLIVKPLSGNQTGAFFYRILYSSERMNVWYPESDACVPSGVIRPPKLSPSLSRNLLKNAVRYL